MLTVVVVGVERKRPQGQARASVMVGEFQIVSIVKILEFHFDLKNLDSEISVYFQHYRRICPF